MPVNVLKQVKTGDSEKDLEILLVRMIRSLDGEAYKFSSPARRSVPDRLCVLPYGVTAFVEIKAPGKIPTLSQGHELIKLTLKGHTATFVNSRESIQDLRGLLINLMIANKKRGFINS